MPTPSPSRRPLIITIASAIVTLVLAGVHHIFRLGPELIVPTVVAIALVAILGWRIQRTSSKLALWALTALNTLVFVWFGVVDGILDHVLKALGFEHVTLLPGGEEENVATYFQLGSSEASSAFYEWTGIGEGLASTVMIVATVTLVVSATRKAKADR